MRRLTLLIATRLVSLVPTLALALLIAGALRLRETFPVADVRTIR